MHGRDENACNILIGKLEEKDQSEDLGVDGNIQTLSKQGGRVWTGCICLSIVTSDELL
jgi:hypothetical protein